MPGASDSGRGDFTTSRWSLHDSGLMVCGYYMPSNPIRQCERGEIRGLPGCYRIFGRQTQVKSRSLGLKFDNNRAVLEFLPALAVRIFVDSAYNWCFDWRLDEGKYPSKVC